MNVNEILDLLEVEEIHNVEEIIINPPGGDDSDGYDDSDTEEGVAASLSRPSCRRKCWRSELEEQMLSWSFWLKKMSKRWWIRCRCHHLGKR